MFYSLLFLSLLQVLHGLPEPSFRIHYGEDSSEPYVLYFERRRGMKATICTASLIKKQYILTAAHCFKKASNKTSVTYGCSDLRSADCKRVDVVSWKFPPDYTAGDKPTHEQMYDIAVAKLESPIGIEPISLPSGEKTNWIPTGMAYLVGYGFTEIPGKYNFYQRSTTLPIVETSHDPRFGNTPEKIVVKSLKSRADIGDSGGPLIIDNTLYGVLWGGTDGASEQIYMSVNYYREFIDSAIEALENE